MCRDIIIIRCYTASVSDDRDLRNGAPQPFQSVSYPRLPSPTYTPPCSEGGVFSTPGSFQGHGHRPTLCCYAMLDGFRALPLPPTHGVLFYTIDRFSEALHEMGLNQIDPVVLGWS